MKINILVEGTKFEEASINEQEEIKKKITNVQKDIVIGRLIKMAKEGKIEEMEDYLRYCSNYKEKNNKK